MDDAAIARFASAVLEDLEACEDREEREAGYVRAMRHLASMVKSEVERPTLGALPGFSFIAGELQAPTGEDRETRNAAAKEFPLTFSLFDDFAEVVHAEAHPLLKNDKAPITRRTRQLTMLTSHAHLFCQWGEIAKASSFLYVASASLYALADPEAPGTEGDKRSRLEVLSAMCRVGAVAAGRAIPITAASFARRVTADLGAIARAAARLEGLPELDPFFDLHGGDSVRGWEPSVALLAAEEMGRGLKRIPAEKPSTPSAVVPMQRSRKRP
ncbi:MAG: hypothetical protein JNK72_24980 [Myxococcales bacterium]|nr:hypothetical protein [Myxococcales bacterium]